MLISDLAAAHDYSPNEVLSENLLPDGRKLNVWFTRSGRAGSTKGRYAQVLVSGDATLATREGFVNFYGPIELQCWLFENFPTK